LLVRQSLNLLPANVKRYGQWFVFHTYLR
jgi:hypothetical protein